MVTYPLRLSQFWQKVELVEWLSSFSHHMITHITTPSLSFTSINMNLSTWQFITIQLNHIHIRQALLITMSSTVHLVSLFLLLFSTLMVSLAHPSSDFGFGWGGGSYNSLSPNFYDFSCPQANGIVHLVLVKAIAKDPRMAASLLRLHFHDCFVQVD